MEKPETMSDTEWALIQAMPEPLRNKALALWISIQQRETPPPAPIKPPRSLQLPLWPEDGRGTPNSFLRSAIFSATKTRKFLKNELLASQSGYEILFTGETLNQSDLSVWQQAAHYARRQPLGNECFFNGHEFLKAIGSSAGKANYEWLNASLKRMVACAVEVRHGKRFFVGSLISSFTRDDETRLYKVSFDKDILKLFGPGDWSIIGWHERLLLKGKPLAQWLHGYARSHAEPMPLKVETIRKLSGSETGNLRNFKIALKAAFEILEKAAGISAIFGEDDLIRIRKTPSGSQARYLLKKKH
jgi:hypothetical protein